MIARPEPLEHGPIRAMLHAMKTRIVRWALRGVAVTDLKAGTNTITLSPGGTDVVRWSGTQAPQSAGDIGMNVATGQPQWHNGVSPLSMVDHGDMVGLADDDHLQYLRTDGTRALTGPQSAGNNKITNVANPTLSTDAATKAYVDSIASGVTWLEPVICLCLVGNLTVAQIDALGNPGNVTDIYLVTDTGVLTLGALAVNPGDLVQWDNANTQWIKVQTGSGGFVPAGTRVALNTTAPLVAPYTEGVDDGKIVEFDGTSNNPLVSGTVEVPNNGDSVLVVAVPGQTPPVLVNRSYVFNGAVPTGTWVQFGGAGGAHSALSGLAADDHTQYALLAGRGAGQTLIGGVNASASLSLQSTSNVTKGSVVSLDTHQFDSDMILNGNLDFRPAADGQGELGTNAFRFASVRAVNVTTGDLHMERIDDHSGETISWTLREYPDGLRAVNQITGEEFDIALKRRSGLRAGLRRALGL